MKVGDVIRVTTDRYERHNWSGRDALKRGTVGVVTDWMRVGIDPETHSWFVRMFDGSCWWLLAEHMEVVDVQD